VRSALGLEPRHELVATVGSLTVQKAQHVLLDAFARVHAARPEARLVIAGEGPLREGLERQAAGLGITDVVHFAGAREDIADLMDAADLFVLSSVREGLPITLLEAMRAGRPAVVTRIGGMPEVVEDGVTGRVVAAGDAAALGDAVAAVLADAARREAMGLAAARRWSERYTGARMVAETERLYREARPRGRRAAVGPAGSPHAAP
jgi:glycosyltransferase involved in cell wall biosynthesis